MTFLLFKYSVYKYKMQLMQYEAFHILYTCIKAGLRPWFLDFGTFISWLFVKSLCCHSLKAVYFLYKLLP